MDITALLEHYTERTAGVYVRNDNFALAAHYENMLCFLRIRPKKRTVLLGEGITLSGNIAMLVEMLKEFEKEKLEHVPVPFSYSTLKQYTHSSYWNRRGLVEITNKRFRDCVDERDINMSNPQATLERLSEEIAHDYAASGPLQTLHFLNRTKNPFSKEKEVDKILEAQMRVEIGESFDKERFLRRIKLSSVDLKFKCEWKKYSLIFTAN